MVTASKEEILRDLAGSLTMGKTIRSISISLKKPYPHVHRHIHDLIKQGIVTKRNVGASCLCRINLKDEAAIIALSGIALDESRLRSPKLAEKIVEQIGSDAMAIVFDKKVFILNEGDLIPSKKRALRNMKTPIDIIDSSSFFSKNHEMLPLILSGQYKYIKRLSEVCQ